MALAPPTTQTAIPLDTSKTQSFKPSASESLTSSANQKNIDTAKQQDEAQQMNLLNEKKKAVGFQNLSLEEKNKILTDIQKKQKQDKLNSDLQHMINLSHVGKAQISDQVKADIAAQQPGFAEQQQAVQDLQNPNQNGLPAPNVNIDTTQGATEAKLALGEIGAGAAIGAGVGAAFGGVGAIPGAVIGAAGGLAHVLAKVAIGKKQVTKEAHRTFIDAKSQDKNILNLANSGQYPPSEVVALYKQNYANKLEAERVLKGLTKNKTGAALSKAQDELIQVEDDLNNENQRINELSLALQNPNPSKVYQINDFSTLDLSNG